MKMIFVLTIIFAINSIFAYDEKCSWGESHWCSSLNNAVGCGALQHCKDTVWKYNVAYKQDTEDVCQFCTEMIGDVKKFILDNETKATIEEYIHLACEQIPVPELEKVCTETVDQNLDELLKIISADLDPKMICGVLGLCSGFEDRTLRFVPEGNSVHVQKVESITTNNVEGKICDDCKKIVQDFIDQLDNPDNREELEELIKLNICAQLPLQALKDACDSIIDEYIPEMADLIADSLDPLIMCQVLELCAGDKDILVKMRLKKSPLYIAMEKNSGTEECYICTTAISEFRQMEGNPKIRKEVLKFLENSICTHLGSYKSECIDTIQIYGVQILDIISTELDPIGICNTFGLCKNSNNMASLQAQSIMRQIMPAAVVANSVKIIQSDVKLHAKSSIQCSICEEVFGALEAELQNNVTLKRVTAMIEKICKVLPDTIKAECKSFVDEYAAAIVDLLIQQLTPEIACTELGFCDGNNSPWTLRITKTSKLRLPEPNVDLCPVCESVISTIDQFLKDNTTKAQIKQFVKMTCDVLPSSLREQCDEMIVANVDKIIDFIADGISPEQICQELGLCKESASLFKPFNVLQPVQVQKVNLLGASKCTWGPSYWCSSIANAEECGTKKHCQDNVWSKKNLN